MATTTSPEALLAHADFVRGLARSLLFDPDAAEDLAQQAWLAAIEHPPSRPERARSWFAAVVINLARKSWRGAARRETRERAAARPEAVPSTAEIVEREAVRRRVVEAVLSLAEPYRSTVLLRYYEDVPPAEIARRLGDPVETVKTRLKRGLAQLRARLDAEHGGNRSTWGVVLLPFAHPGGGAGPSGESEAANLEGVLAVGAKTKLGLAASILVLVGGFGARAFLASPTSPPDAGLVSSAPSTAPRTIERDATLPAPREGAARDQSDRPPVPSDARESTGRTPASPPAPGARVSGSIRDEAGRPLPDAWVVGVAGPPPREIPLDDSAQAADRPTVRRCRSNGEGRWALDGVTAGPWVFGAHANGQGIASSAAIEVPPNGSIEGIDLALPPEALLHGRVVGVDGQPVPDAGIRVSARGPAADAVRATHSGADGTFALRGLPAGTHRGTVVAAGYLEHRPELATGQVEHVLRLTPALMLDVRLLAPGDPSPEVATLGLEILSSEEDRNGLVQSVGAEASERRPEGCHRIREADLSFYWSSERRFVRIWALCTDGRFGSSAVLPRGPGGRRDVEVPILPDRLIRGRVVDAGGQPISGARVRYGSWIGGSPSDIPGKRAFPQHEPRWAGVATDPEGRFTLRVCGAGPYALLARADGFEPAVGPPVSQDEPSDTNAVEVVLRRPTEGCRVRGRVQEAGGLPLVAATIEVSIERGGEWVDVRATADAEGRFVFTEPLPPGQYDFGISLGGLSVGNLERALGSGPEIELELILPRRVEVGSLGGRVERDGRAWGAARVLLRPVGGGGWVDALTTTDGAFEFACLPAGDYTLYVQPAGNAAAVHLQAVQVSPRAAPIEVRVQPATLRGRLAIPVGTPTAGGVYIEPTLEEARLAPADSVEGWRERWARPIAYWARVDDDGEFELPALIPGRHRFALTVFGQGGWLPLETLTLEPGETRLVDWAVRQRSRVHGRVLDAAGQPVPDASVNVVLGSGGPGTPGPALLPTEGSVRITDADGRFDLRVPWAGKADLRVWRTTGSGAQRPIELPEGGALEIELRLR